MEHTKNLCSAVVEQGADIGFAFDGDGDRLIAVDSNGQTVTGDQILAVCAKFMVDNGRLQNNMAVSTVMSNVTGKTLKTENQSYHEEMWGPVCSEAMKQHKAVIGGEDSGHMIFLDHHTPGDGIFTASLIRIITEANQLLSELVRIISIYPQVPLNAGKKNRYLNSRQSAIKLMRWRIN
ncbi:MAG: hypothetical protein R2860_02820 [Desulfobacterales bacterium]